MPRGCYAAALVAFTVCAAAPTAAATRPRPRPLSSSLLSSSQLPLQGAHYNPSDGSRAFGRNWSREVVDRDFAVAASAGLSWLRVFFDPTPATGYAGDPNGTVAGWHDAVALAKKHGLKFFVFFAFVDIPPLSTPGFEVFLHTVFTEFNNDDTVNAFVLDVEPAVSPRTPEAYVRQLYAMAHNLTTKPLTMGMASGWVPSMGPDWKKAPAGWCYRACESVVGLADAIFYHSYAWNVTFKRLEFEFWSKIAADLGGAPLAITEFGNRPGDSTCMDAMLAADFNASTAVYQLFDPGHSTGVPAQGVFYPNGTPIVPGEAACLGTGAAKTLYLDPCESTRGGGNGGGGGGGAVTVVGNWTPEGGRYGGPTVRPQFGTGCYLTAAAAGAEITATVGGGTVSAYLYHAGVSGAVKVMVNGAEAGCVTAASLAALPNPALVTLKTALAPGSHKVALTTASSCGSGADDASADVGRSGDNAGSDSNSAMEAGGGEAEESASSPAVLAAVGPVVGTRPT